MTVSALVEPFLGPVSSATLAFPFAACLAAVPFAIYHYRAYGHVHPWRAVVGYSFIYYLIAVLFLAILPLPELPARGAETEAWNTRYGELRTPRVDPSGFVRDVVRAESRTERTRAVFQAVFNMLLLLPFGSYLAYGFGRTLSASALLALLASLFLELLQLTGILWIYPGPYRLFDAGDLLLNTAGAVTGWLAARGLARLGILPRLDSLRGAADPWIGPFRRLVAFALDASALALSVLAATLLLDLTGAGSGAAKAVAASSLAVFWLVLLPALDRGRGVGRRLTVTAIRRSDGRHAGAGRLLARQAVRWVPPALAWAAAGIRPAWFARALAVEAALLVWLALWLLDALKATFGAEHAGYLDRALGLRVRDTWSERTAGAAAQGKARRATRPRPRRRS